MIRLALFALFAVVLSGFGGCPPRVAPVGTITPDPTKAGAYVMNAALPQPDAADYQGGAGGWLDLVGMLLPQPWGAVLASLGTALVAAPLARRGPLRALKQTVCGIEKAKAILPASTEAIHGALAEAQDEDTKRTVWELRP